jgi:hypothetical protein
MYPANTPGKNFVAFFVEAQGCALERNCSWRADVKKLRKIENSSLKSLYCAFHPGTVCGIGRASS